MVVSLDVFGKCVGTGGSEENAATEFMNCGKQKQALPNTLDPRKVSEIGSVTGSVTLRRGRI